MSDQAANLMGPLHVSFEAQNFTIENTSIERQKNRILIQEAKKPRQSMFNLLLAWKAALHNNAMLWFCVHGRASAYNTLINKKFCKNVCDVCLGHRQGYLPL